MTHKQFDEFVEMQAKPGLSDAEKANAISEWTGDIVAFYELVDSFLQPYTVSGKILVGRKPKQMHEDLIGDYETQTNINHDSNNILSMPANAASLVAVH